MNFSTSNWEINFKNKHFKHMFFALQYCTKLLIEITCSYINLIIMSEVVKIQDNELEIKTLSYIIFLFKILTNLILNTF